MFCYFCRDFNLICMTVLHKLLDIKLMAKLFRNRLEYRRSSGCLSWTFIKNIEQYNFIDLVAVGSKLNIAVNLDLQFDLWKKFFITLPFAFTLCVLTKTFNFTMQLFLFLWNLELKGKSGDGWIEVLSWTSKIGCDEYFRSIFKEF